jgi:hypothetical protein
MMRGYVLVYALTLVAGCGGGKKKVAKPKTEEVKNEEPGADTEADREKKRRMLARQIVPDGTTCLPTALKDANAPRLELAAIGKDAVVCAIDEDRTRLLGPVGCWSVNLSNGALTYKDPEPLPGRSVTVMLDDRCARDYCVPKGAKLGDDKVAFMAKNVDGSKVAVLVGDEVHLFNAGTKAHESSFTIRGDKGVTNDPKAVHYVDGSVIVEGIGEGPFSAAWVFKSDGTPQGPIAGLGGKEEKPVSTYHGSFSILDKARVAVSEKGMETLTTYEVETGKRTKLVRKVGKLACKSAELDAFWTDGKVSDKCRDSVRKASGHLMGATVVAGAKSLLVMLRGDRLGELAVMDAKTLAEKSTIKMPWCDAGGAKKAEAKDESKDEKPRAAEKAAPKKAKKGGGDSSDPQEGGE